MSLATPAFLGIPVEVRLVIYEYYLSQHQCIRNKQQPSNLHIQVLHTCRQIDREAGDSFRQYVSLRNERQITAFILNARESLTTQVKWADVANDGRVFEGAARTSKDDEEVAPTPLSNLHLALRRMTSIKRLRVFQCRQGLPVDPQRLKAGRPAIKFENSMYPSGPQHQLTSYELFLEPETRVLPFDVVPPQAVETLRLSGECHIAVRPVATPSLRRVTLYGIAGHAFDQRTLEDCFPGSRLEAFVYGLGHRLGFEIRNRHLESLASARGAQLRMLVLLGCSRLTSTAIATCVHNLPALEHFALGLITVDELRTNFVLSLPPGVAVVKLQVTNAWYAVPLLNEERGLCDALEDTILRRDVAPRCVSVEFRDGLMLEDGRRERWKEIARSRHFKLSVGPWENECMENM